jgi:hypothetical protein
MIMNSRLTKRTPDDSVDAHLTVIKQQGTGVTVLLPLQVPTGQKIFLTDKLLKGAMGRRQILAGKALVPFTEFIEDFSLTQT